VGKIPQFEGSKKPAGAGLARLGLAGFGEGGAREREANAEKVACNVTKGAPPVVDKLVRPFSVAERVGYRISQGD